MTEQKKRTGIILGSVLLCAVMQFYGCSHYYDVGKDFFKVLDILPVFVACLCGTVPGLLCLIPAAVSEILWTIQLAAPGPLINLASFFITGVVVGKLSEKIDRHKLWPKLALMEAVLLLMRLVILLLRLCFSMKSVSLTYLVLSVPNVYFIALMIVAVRYFS